MTTMRPLQLDFQRRARVATPIGWIMLAVGMIATGIAARAVFVTSRDIQNAEYTLARLDRKPVPVTRGEIARGQAARLDDEIEFANAVAERLTMPWEDLLRTLEAATTGDVALLSVQPDAQRKVLRITAETKTKTEMLAYLERLGRSSTLSSVQLLNHEVGVLEPGQPVRFSMQASWGTRNHARN